MSQSRHRLVMIYNADGGLLNAIGDSVHKLFSPSTYPCSLCALSYGTFAIRREWKEFLAKLPLEKLELHKDDYRTVFPDLEMRLPVILLEGAGDERQVIAGAQEMGATKCVGELIALVRGRLREAGVVA